MPRVGLMISAGTLCIVTLAVTATSAAAVSPASRSGRYYTTDGTRIRTGASTSATVLGLAYKSQDAIVYCYTFGTSVNGDTYWIKNKDVATGVTGYSSYENMSNVPLTAITKC